MVTLCTSAAAAVAAAASGYVFDWLMWANYRPLTIYYSIIIHFISAHWNNNSTSSTNNRYRSADPFFKLLCFACGLLMRWLRSPFPVCWFIAQLSFALSLLCFFFCFGILIHMIQLAVHRWVVEHLATAIDCNRKCSENFFSNTQYHYCLLVEYVYVCNRAHRRMNEWRSKKKNTGEQTDKAREKSVKEKVEMNKNKIHRWMCFVWNVHNWVGETASS